MPLQHLIHYYLARFHLALRPSLDRAWYGMRLISEFDPKVTQRLIGKAGQPPEGVQKR